MNKKELEERTRGFALQVIIFVGALPKNRIADILGKQLLRAGTSIGANYREANRAESRQDFHHKIALVEKEAAETLYWLQLCRDSHLGDSRTCETLLDEADQLLAIFTAVGKNTSSTACPQVKEEIPDAFA